MDFIGEVIAAEVLEKERDRIQELERGVEEKIQAIAAAEASAKEETVN